MKRMSELRDNLRGVKCDATKAAFRYLKKQKRKPRVGEVPTAYYIRVQIDGQRYDYYAASGTWAVTRRRGADGRWRKAEDVTEFYRLAMERSAIRNSDEATEKQLAFIDSLIDQTGASETEGARDSKSAANEEIDRLLRIKAAQKFGYSQPGPSLGRREKPRLSAVDQKVWLAISNRASQGLQWTEGDIADCCGVEEGRAAEAIERLARWGLAPLSANRAVNAAPMRVH